MKKFLLSVAALVMAGTFPVMAADREQFNVTKLYLGGTEVTATAAELNKMDGVTATAAQINGATLVGSNQIVIGNASGIGVAKTLSGDITTATNGAVTIAAGAVTAAKTSLASNTLMIGNSSGIAASVTVSGDLTTTTAGAFTVTRGTAFTNTFVTGVAGLTATSINVISRSVAYNGLYVTLGAITTNAVNTDVP